MVKIGGVRSDGLPGNTWATMALLPEVYRVAYRTERPNGPAYSYGISQFGFMAQQMLSPRIDASHTVEMNVNDPFSQSRSVLGLALVRRGSVRAGLAPFLLRQQWPSDDRQHSELRVCHEIWAVWI